VTDPMNATTPSPTPGSSGTRDRFSAAVRRLGEGLEDLLRRGNRRRLSVRGRDGTVWLRLPLTVAAVVAIVLAATWFFGTVLLIVVLFALGFQVSVDRHVDDGGTRPRSDAPGSAA
jgi:hypothetical protein